MHHKFTAPIAPSAEYAHPIEHLVANVIPIIAGTPFLSWVFVDNRSNGIALAYRYVLDFYHFRVT